MHLRWRCLNKLRVGVREGFVWTIINILLFRLTSFGTLGLLLSHTVNSRAWINIIIDSPVRSLPSIGERTWDFLKAWVERKIMSDRILKYSMVSVCFVGDQTNMNTIKHQHRGRVSGTQGTRCNVRVIDRVWKVSLTFQPEGAVLKYGNWMTWRQNQRKAGEMNNTHARFNRVVNVFQE